MNRPATAQGIAGKASPARLPFARWLFTAFMVLAFALQSYAVQTHIHEQLNLPVAAKAGLGNVLDARASLGDHAKKPGAPAKAPLPVKDNPDDCPLCQLLYGGQYVAPIGAGVFPAPGFGACHRNRTGRLAALRCGFPQLARPRPSPPLICKFER